MESLNSCMPLLINNVTSTLSPQFLLKEVSATILPIITTIVNLSLSTGTFPMQFKQSLVTPLLKKTSVDKDTLNNYRPISNLSLISKITERIVKSRLNEHPFHLTSCATLINLLYQISLHRNYSFVLTWPPNYSNKTSTSLLPLPSRPFCCLWHHRLLNSPPSSVMLVRYCRVCPYMVRHLLNISPSLFLPLVLHHLPISFPVAYSKALSLALSFSTCTSHLSTLSSHLGH